MEMKSNLVFQLLSIAGRLRTFSLHSFDLFAPLSNHQLVHLTHSGKKTSQYQWIPSGPFSHFPTINSTTPPRSPHRHHTYQHPKHRFQSRLPEVWGFFLFGKNLETSTGEKNGHLLVAKFKPNVGKYSIDGAFGY